MSEPDQTSLTRFLVQYGRYYVPGRTFYHRQLGLRLHGLGFRVLSIQRLATHPVWQVRIKQTHFRWDFLSTFRLLKPKLKAQVRRALKDLDRGIKAPEIVVVCNGVYIQVAFVWPLGKPATWRPSPSRPGSFAASQVFRDCLREQRN